MEKRKNKFDAEAPVKFICNHLVGENHKEKHRIYVGLCVMVFGVAVASVCREFTNSHLVAGAGDMVGYLIHGMGCVPILKRYVG